MSMMGIKDISEERTQKQRDPGREIHTAALVFFLLWLAFLYKFLLGQVLCGGDLVNQYIPYKMFFKEWVHKGIVPLWNPYTFSGRPFQADIQIGMFYPPNLLCLILPIPIFFNVLTFLHLWFASLGSYAFARRFLKHPASRYLFSLCFSFSAFFTARLYSGIVLYIFTAAYIPWILLASEKWAETRNAKSAILFGILLTLQILAGSPQLAFYTWICLGILFLLQGIRSKGASPLWVGYAIAFVLMLALSAVQFIPTKEFIDHSYERQGGARWEYITDGSLHFKSLITFIAPNFFSPPKREDILWASLLGFWEYNGYVGIGPLVLSVLFFFLHPWKKSLPALPGHKTQSRLLRLSLVLFLFWMCLAFGKHSLIFWFFYKFVPGFNRFRVPARLVLYYIMALSFVSSIAFDRFIEIARRSDEDSMKRLRRIPVVLLVIVLLALGISIPFFLSPFPILQWFGVEKFVPMNQVRDTQGPFKDIVLYAKSSILIFDVFLLFSCGLIFLMISQRKRNLPFPYIFLGMIALDLFLFSIFHIETVPLRNFQEKFYPKTELSQFLRSAIEARQRIVWTDDVFWWQYDQNQLELYPNRAMVQGLYDTRGYDPVFLRTYGELFNAVGYLPNERSPGGLLKLEQIHNPHLLSLLNVRYILTYNPDVHPAGCELIKRFPSGLYVYENKNAFGNAFLRNSFPVADEVKDQILKAMWSPKFPHDKWAITQDRNPYMRKPGEKGTQGESVRVLEYAPNRREYEAVVKDSDTLVFSEVYYPGWKIYVDGKPVPSNIVDHALLAVFLPPGAHRVVCLFRPFSFMMGAFISFLTLLGLLIGCIVNLWRTKWKRVENTMPQNPGNPH